jgi:hypothetical protein
VSHSHLPFKLLQSPRKTWNSGQIDTASPHITTRATEAFVPSVLHLSNYPGGEFKAPCLLLSTVSVLPNSSVHSVLFPWSINQYSHTAGKVLPSHHLASSLGLAMSSEETSQRKNTSNMVGWRLMCTSGCKHWTLISSLHELTVCCTAETNVSVGMAIMWWNRAPSHSRHPSKKRDCNAPLNINYWTAHVQFSFMILNRLSISKATLKIFS